MVSTIPAAGPRSIVVALPTTDRSIASRLEALPVGGGGMLAHYVKDIGMTIHGDVVSGGPSKGRPTPHDYDDVTGLKVRAGHIVFGYYRGIRKVLPLLTPEECAKSEWTGELYELLGALNVNVATVLVDLPSRPLNTSVRLRANVQRLFLMRPE